jgi:hypothetical protein
VKENRPQIPLIYLAWLAFSVLAPWAACLYVFWPGIRAWFQADDFAWLGLHLHIHSFWDFLRAMFEPKAQGTIRPFSERLFFTGFYWIFGLDALPYRVWVFATQLVNLVLVGAIARRITGSMMAGVAAPVFWAVNASLGVPLSWTSSYNQILCATFILTAFYCFVRLTESGARRWRTRMWAAFLLGFGALEMNVVFPALAAGYAWLRSREYLTTTLPMFVISGLYALAHRTAAPPISSGPYAMRFDLAILRTLATYWQTSFGGARMTDLPVDERLQILGLAAPWVLSAALLLFLGASLLRRRWLRLFPLWWFLVLIAPVLPLRDHLSDYYLTLPTIGLAVLGGWAFSRGWHQSMPTRIIAVLAAVLYIGTSAPVGRAVAEYNRQRSQAVRRLVQGVAHARNLHPDKMILLNSVSSDLFWAGVNDKPFRLYGVEDVFLTPEAEETIEAHPELGDVGEFVLPAAVLLEALKQRQAAVYSAAAVDRGGMLKNITRLYAALAKARLKAEWPRRIHVGHPAFANQLGEGWHEVEGGYRWMSRRAQVWLGGPKSPEDRLHIAGFCPAAQLRKGAVGMTVWVDKSRLGHVLLDKADQEFRFSFALPPDSLGRERVEVVLEVNRTFTTEGDGRELGAAFGILSIR